MLPEHVVDQSAPGASDFLNRGSHVRFVSGALISLTVGFRCRNFKTYEDQLASDEKLGSAKLEGSGSTPGNSGKWWFTSNGGTKTVSATARAPNGKAMMCNTANTTPSAAAFEVCKSLRPFPGK